MFAFHVDSNGMGWYVLARQGISYTHHPQKPKSTQFFYSRFLKVCLSAGAGAGVDVNMYTSPLFSDYVVLGMHSLTDATDLLLMLMVRQS